MDHHAATPIERHTENFMSSRMETDMRLHYCGAERCLPGHHYGPVMRDHYLLHFIVRGSGVFTANGCAYTLKAGGCFLIHPNRPASYRASDSDPWTYYWIGFGGRLAAELVQEAGLTVDSPTLEHRDPAPAESLMAELLQRSGVDGLAAELHCGGLLLQWFGTLLGSRPEARASSERQGEGSGETYVAQAVKFMEAHYQSKLTVSLVAKHVGLERAYFTKLFHARMGVAPYEFLLRYRMEKARMLLNQTSLPVQVIAGSAGFGDAAYFGKAFARQQGMSPTAYRNRP